MLRRPRLAASGWPAAPDAPVAPLATAAPSEADSLASSRAPTLESSRTQSPSSSALSASGSSCPPSPSPWTPPVAGLAEPPLSVADRCERTCQRRAFVQPPGAPAGSGANAAPARQRLGERPRASSSSSSSDASWSSASSSASSAAASPTGSSVSSLASSEFALGELANLELNECLRERARIEQDTTAQQQQHQHQHQQQQQQQQQPQQHQQQQQQPPQATTALHSGRSANQGHDMGPGRPLVAVPVGPLCQQLHLHLSPSTGQRTPRSYPNNTLMADLGECHRNIVHCWPQLPGQRSLSSLRTWSLLGARSASSAKHQPHQPHFRLPSQLLNAQLQLHEQDYDQALSVLSGDIRYQLHLLLYRRAQALWLLLTSLLCVVAPALLVANVGLWAASLASAAWLGLQLAGWLAVGRLRAKLDDMLEKSVAQANGFFMDHNLMLGVINVGGLLTKTRLMIPMLYFDTTQCRQQIESLLRARPNQPAQGPLAGPLEARNWNNPNYCDHNGPAQADRPAAKPESAALAQSLAKKIVLRYSQRWISHYDKQKLTFNAADLWPRHLSTGMCLCQFVERQLGAADERGPQPKVAAAAAATQAPLASLASLSAQVHARGHQQVLAAAAAAPKEVKQRQQQQPKQHQAVQELSCLELDGDCVTPSDDLVRKLRLLLELRSEELRAALDSSSLFATGKLGPQHFLVWPEPDPEPAGAKLAKQAPTSLVELAKSAPGLQADAYANSRLGRKLFGARHNDWLWLASSRLAKPQPTRQAERRVLEIC